MTHVAPRLIAHVDMDAFYASVEQLRYPDLRGRPVVIGGGRRHQPVERADGTRAYSLLRDYAGRGVITTSTYEARALGSHEPNAIRCGEFSASTPPRSRTSISPNFIPKSKNESSNLASGLRPITSENATSHLPIRTMSGFEQSGNMRSQHSA